MIIVAQILKIVYNSENLWYSFIWINAKDIALRLIVAKSVPFSIFIYLPNPFLLGDLFDICRLDLLYIWR